MNRRPLKALSRGYRRAFLSADLGRMYTIFLGQLRQCHFLADGFKRSLGPTQRPVTDDLPEGQAAIEAGLTFAGHQA